MNIYERELENYRKLNKIASTNGIVLFGSSFARAIPACELKQSFNLNLDIYNRSIADSSVFDAEELLNDCVFPLVPKKLFLNFGETDLERGYHTIHEIVAAYEKLITTIKSNIKYCDIIIVSVCNNEAEIFPEELNKQLEELANRTKCQYADISPAFSHDTPGIKAFSLLKYFMRDKITFADAMTMFTV